MLKKIIKLLPVLVLAFTTVQASADAIEISVDVENPPFMYLAGGKPGGLYPALILAAFKEAGQAVDISAKPWKRCLFDTDNSKSGTGGIYKNNERLQKYDFSEPIFVEKMAVYFNKTKPLNFDTVADLFGKKVGVIRGWSYGDDFDKAVKEGKIVAEEVKGDQQNFGKLIMGRVDAVLAIDEAGTATLKDGKYAAVLKSPRYLFENPTFVAFNKSQKYTELLVKFNQAVEVLRKSGELGKIASAELSK